MRHKHKMVAGLPSGACVEGGGVLEKGHGVCVWQAAVLRVSLGAVPAALACRAALLECATECPTA